MSYFGQPKITKTNRPDSTPYTVYYPHTIPQNNRNWTQDYVQYVSIDPAIKNYAFRIERRYHNGWITPVAFDKVNINEREVVEDVTVIKTYENLTIFLEQFRELYNDCHYIIIERQLPHNYQMVRIQQHTISYFSILLHNKPLLPAIIDVCPKLKGQVLKAPKNITYNQLKQWTIQIGRQLLEERQDNYSLSVLEKYRNKQDDLCDTIIQAEALFRLWGWEPIKTNVTLNVVRETNKDILTDENYTVVNIPVTDIVD